MLGGETPALLLLPANAARPQAAAMAEAARRLLSSKPLPSGSGKSIPITICVGVATFEEGQPLREPSHLLKAAELGAESHRSNRGRIACACSRFPSPLTPQPRGGVEIARARCRKSIRFYQNLPRRRGADGDGFLPFGADADGFSNGIIGFLIV